MYTPRSKPKSPPAIPDNPLLREAKRFRAKKRFAQHFLIDPAVIEAITQIVAPQADIPLLEIGPGTGFLTDQLLKHDADLTSVELERSMAYVLRKKFSDHPRFTLVEQSILSFDFSAYGNADGSTPDAPFSVVGNLPYNLTSPILFYLAGELNVPDYPLRRRMQQATIMVQREVGERLTARPGTKAYNSLSIAIQYWFKTEYRLTIPSTAFYPAPKVESAIITLRPRSTPHTPVTDLATFARVVKTAFLQRRKTLKNALLPLIGVDTLAQIFEAIEPDPATHPDAKPIAGLRAEALSIETFAALADAWVRLRVLIGTNGPEPSPA